MSTVLPKQPETNSEWMALLLQKDKLLQNQASQIEHLESRLRWFEEQFHLARHKRHGSSSERVVPEQGNLFNEAEAVLESGEPEEAVRQTIDEDVVRKAGRRPIPQDLGIEVIEHQLPEEELVCSCCGGPMHKMSEETRHEVDLIPARVRMLRRVRYVYGCRNCERNGVEVSIKTAPAPRPVIEKGLASPSSVAYTMSMKFVDGMPLYRQEQRYSRLGIKLSRAVLSNWVVRGSEWLEWIYDRLKKDLIGRDVLHGDETTLQVLKEPGRAAERKSYMWLYRTGSVGPPIALYEYQPTRAGANPKKFLEGFSGYLHVDGYAGYNDIPDTVLVECWAHARRKFDEAQKGLPPKHRKAGTRAREGLDLINRLFAVEREMKALTPEDRLEMRNLKSRPLVEKFRKWLDDMVGTALPKSLFGIAVKYCDQQWPKLVRFLEDGRLELDNNRAERSIKPFVIGRKNWLFSNTPKGARSSAIVYSIVETAKENGLDPYAYLTHLFETLPNMDDLDTANIDHLLPWNVKLKTETENADSGAHPE